MHIRREHFQYVKDEDLARELFRNSVIMVLIENSSYCNRRCTYCPNSLVDRISERKYLDDALFERILTDLRSIDYAHDVMLHSYNEPLANPRIVEIVERIRRSVPRARIGMFSNGDFLTRPLLDQLRDAGLTSMRLSIHLGNTKPYVHEEVVQRVWEMRRRLDLPVEARQEKGVRVWAGFEYPGLDLTMYQENYATSGSNRAGALDIGDHKDRTRPCFHPLGAFYVDYSGAIVPCCHIVSDVEAHKPYVAGNLRDYPSIFQAYANSPLVEWRRTLINTNPKASPCDSCDDVWLWSEDKEEAAAEVHRRFVLGES